MIVFKILLWIILAVSISFSLYIFIYAIADIIRLRSIEKYLISIGYKPDWIFIESAFHKGFSKDSSSEYILWKDLNELTLKQVKETYK